MTSTADVNTDGAKLFTFAGGVTRPTRTRTQQHCGRGCVRGGMCVTGVPQETLLGASCSSTSERASGDVWGRGVGPSEKTLILGNMYF